MTTKLERILELLNSKLQRGIIKKEDFEILKELVIQYEDYIDKIENIHYFVMGLVNLKIIGYDEKDISVILEDISNLGIKEIDEALFEFSIYIYKRYYEEFRKYFEEKSKSIKKIIKSSPNIDNILYKLEDKIKVLFNDNNETYIEIENSIENIKKCNILSLSYMYYIIQNWQNGYYIEKLENIREQISCTIKNLEYIKSNLENILKDLRDSRYIKDIQNIKRELDIYYNGLLNIIKEIDTYKQSYIKFNKECLSRLLSEGLDYTKEYENINSNEGNINMSLT